MASTDSRRHPRQDPAAEFSWTVETPAGWLTVPPRGFVRPAVVAEWERNAVALVAETLARDAGPRTSRDHLAEAADAVANLREFADGVAPAGHRVLAAPGIMGRTPVPVMVAVGIGGPDSGGEGLLAALGATGGNPLAPPMVEHPDLPDGDGVRVTRFDLGEETGSAWVSVTLGRRREYPDAVADTVLVCRTQDLFVAAFLPDLLDELLPAVTISRREAR